MREQMLEVLRKHAQANIALHVANIECKIMQTKHYLHLNFIQRNMLLLNLSIRNDDKI